MPDLECAQKNLSIHTTFELKTTNKNIKVLYKIHPSLKEAIIERNKKKKNATML